MKGLLRILLPPALCLVFCLGASAQTNGGVEYGVGERILEYHSDVEVFPDASMLVRESIRVRADGDRIRRGIYRDFPTRYKDHLGNNYVVDFEVVEILRDGKPDGYHLENQMNGTRVYVGRESVFLNPGEYTYTLAYRTNRQLGFFPDHDELYWNVTGNGWDFEIDQVSATVRLPKGISREDIKLEAYTGAQGSRDKDFQASKEFDGTVRFETTQMLPSNHGLTIVVGWPKGIVAEPTAEVKAGYFIRDNRNVLVGGLGVFLLFVYYMVVWARVGKDPESGPIMVLYEPPHDFSPAAIRYLTKMGFDDKTFAAAVINMAVKNYVSIKDKDGTYTVARRKDDKSALSPDEKAAVKHLLDSSGSIELKNDNHASISAAREALTATLKTSLEKVYFVTNGRYMIPGIVITIATVAAIALFAESLENRAVAGFMTIWLSGWTVGVYFLLSQALTLWKSALSGWGKNLLNLPAALFMSLFALPFLAGEIAGLWFYSQAASVSAVILLLGMLALNILFYHLLKAPTRAGRVILDRIEGFKMFLTAVEVDRMRAFSSINKTPELFEKYLPYALALDCEEQWSQQFAEVFARAAQSGQTYTPAFYSGSNWNSLSPGNFASSLGSSFSSAISSSATAPGSSSGFSGGGGGGGGGSSGGGGGGGGGGGW